MIRWIDYEDRAVGDMLIATGIGKPSVPVGWTDLSQADDHRVLAWHIIVPGDADPKFVWPKGIEIFVYRSDSKWEVPNGTVSTT